MKKFLFCICATILTCGALCAAPLDKNVKAALSEVSEARLEASVYKLASFGTRHTASEEDSQKRGIGAARRWIFSEMKKSEAVAKGRLTVSEDWFEGKSKRIEAQPVANVVAILKGVKDPMRCYVVGGHYDSRVTDIMNSKDDAPGADDDGSGTAASMELLRVMAPYEFDATLIFVAFVGEEQGLLGSKHLVKKLVEEGYTVDGMLALDIIGNTTGGTGITDDRNVRCFSKGIADGDSLSREWARYVERMAKRYVRGIDVNMVFRLDRYGRGGDHYPFDAEGLPAARLSETLENYEREHQDLRVEDGVEYGDRPEYVDYAYTAKVTRVAGAALMNAALAPAPPSDVVVKGAVSYDTALSWEAVEHAAGYSIVWRKTTQPQWTYEKKVGKVSEAVLKDIIVDNFIFGVKSLGEDGHESRVQPAIFKY